MLEGVSERCMLKCRNYFGEHHRFSAVIFIRNYLPPSGVSPLRRALMSLKNYKDSGVRVVTALLEAGADVNEMLHREPLPWNCALPVTVNADVASESLPSSPGERHPLTAQTPLHLALSQYGGDLVPDLLAALDKAGARWDFRDSNGWTSLHWAVSARSGDSGCCVGIRACLQRGVDPILTDEHSKCALDYLLEKPMPILMHPLHRPLACELLAFGGAVVASDVARHFCCFVTGWERREGVSAITDDIAEILVIHGALDNVDDFG